MLGLIAATNIVIFHFSDAVRYKTGYRFKAVTNVTAALLSRIVAKMELDYFDDCDLCAMFVAWYSHVIWYSNGCFY